jgi:integrase
MDNMELGIFGENDNSEKGLVAPITDITKLNAMCKILKEGKFGDRNYLLFVIGINTGIRVSDYTNMTIGQFREICDRGYIVLVPSKTDKRKIDENGNIVGKYKKIRIDISEGLRNCIADYIKDKDDKEYMFPSKKGGTPIKRQTVWLILNEAAKKAEIKENIGCHSMRKTFGYWHYQQNHDIRLLMEIFQHSSEDVTLRYIGINAEKMKDSMKNMSLGI